MLPDAQRQGRTVEVQLQAQQLFRRQIELRRRQDQQPGPPWTTSARSHFTSSGPAATQVRQADTQAP